MDIVKIHKLSKKILKVEEELEHYSWDFLMGNDADEGDMAEYYELKDKLAKLLNKLNKELSKAKF